MRVFLNRGLVNIGYNLHRAGLLGERKTVAFIEGRMRAVQRPWNWRRCGTAAFQATLWAGLAYAIYLIGWLALSFVRPNCADPAFAPIVASLRDHPGKWASTAHQIVTHASGVQVSFNSWSFSVSRVDGDGDRVRDSEVDGNQIGRQCKSLLTEYGEAIVTRDERVRAEAASAAAIKAVSK